MIITETLNIKWTRNNKQHYIKIGYEFTEYGDDLEIKIVDLLPNSTIKILCKCDYCGEEKEKPYSLYNGSINRSEIKKYACKKCNIKKQKETNLHKYGRSDALGYFEDLRQKKKEFRTKYYKEKRG